MILLYSFKIWKTLHICIYESTEDTVNYFPVNNVRIYPRRIFCNAAHNSVSNTQGGSGSVISPMYMIYSLLNYFTQVIVQWKLILLYADMFRYD